MVIRYIGCGVGGLRGNVMATSFHPEVGGDDRIHGMFVDMVARA